MIEITTDSEQVLGVLEALIDRLEDMSPAMADIAQALQSESEQQFQDESGPLGAWPQLSDQSTIPLRAAQGKWPGQILQMSAAGLASSIQTGYDDRSAWIGSNKPYAAMHFFGGTTSPFSMIPNKEIPARPYLPFHPVTGDLTPDAEATILEVIAQYLAS